MIFKQIGCDVYMLIRGIMGKSLENVGIDRDIATTLVDSLRKAGVIILEETSFVSCDVPETRSEPLECDVFLNAIGYSPRVEELGLDKFGVEYDQRFKFIKHNERFETTVPGIYAAGDVCGRPALVCTGVIQAQAAVCAMFDEPPDQTPDEFPLAMWTTPECAYYGQTLAAATKEGIDAEEGLAQYHQCLRGRVFAPSGILKLVFRKGSGVIIGVHIVGEDACE